MMSIENCEAEATVSEERRQEALEIVSRNPYQVNWDGWELTEDMVKEFLRDWDKQHDLTPVMFLENYLDEHLSYGEIGDRGCHVDELLQNAGFTDEERTELQESQIYAECPLNHDLEHFLDQDVNVRFELLSNHDCINSTFLETDGYRIPFQTEKTYLGDVLGVLHLDPAKLNEVSGLLRFEPWHDTLHLHQESPLVDHKQFVRELENTCNGANLLTLPVKVPFRDLGNKTFTIPKDTPVGFYSDFQGGGSMFQCRLLRDMEIVIPDEKTWGNKPFWRWTADFASGYSMTECYGHFLG